MDIFPAMVVDFVTSVVVGVAAQTAPPAEPVAAPTYSYDCVTTRAGVEMSCTAATQQDLDKANQFRPPR